jgi:RNA polymerase sigma-B factor
VVESHLGLARHIARRYSAGRRDDDLDQVARLALIDAVDRFDADRGVTFASYAGITIEGAIKRYVSRTAWPVAVPRRVKSLAVGLDAARERLEQRLGRSPTVAELAGEMGESPDDVLEALAARATRSTAAVDDDTSPAQSRNDDRKPWTVVSAPIRRMSMASAMDESGLPRS